MTSKCDGIMVVVECEVERELLGPFSAELCGSPVEAVATGSG